MKEPTTDFAIEAQNKIQINRGFLESEGWILEEERPLYESFTRPNSEIYRCTISMYGGFAITEYHWCNRTPERTFQTLNAELSKQDYHDILRMLNIKLL